MLLRALLRRVHEAILRRPGRVVVAAILLAAVAAALAGGVEYRTSRSELAPPDDPEQRRFDDLIREFDGSQQLVACVVAAPGSAPTPEDARSFLDRLAADWRALPEVREVFHRIDLGAVARTAPYLAPPERVEALADALLAAADGAARAPGLTGFDRALAGALETGLARGTAEAAGAGESAGGLTPILRWQREFVEDPDRALAAVEGRDPFELLARAAPGGRTDGYVATADGTMWIAFLTPTSSADDLPALRRLLAAVRSVADRAVAADPRFRVGWTGNPAMTVEEMDAVRADTWKTSAIAALGVAVLTLLVFRWRTHALLVLAVLALGIVWSLGAVRLEYGYLNLITSAFVSTLIGVGVAYGIHPMSEYELAGAHTRDPDAAVDAAFHRTGPAVATSAATTAVAFFAVLLMRFRGFAELGLVAGVGVLLCLAAVLLVQPCLTVLYGRRRARRDRATREGAAGATVDRLWVEAGAEWVCRFPRAVVAVSIVATIAAAVAATGIGFDTDLLELLPADSEAASLQRRMARDADVSPLSAIVTAEDVDDLRRLRERAAGEPTVRSFDSLLRFLPDDPSGSARAVARLADALAAWPSPDAGDDLDPARLREAVARVEAALADAGDAAFAAGLGETAAALEDARGEAEATLAALDRRLADGSVATLVDGERRLRAWAASALAEVRRAVTLPPPTVDTLPSEIRDRFTTSGGRLVALLQPAGQVFDPAFLDGYVDAARRVSPEATGFPVVFRHMARRITAGFHRAVAVGAILVFLVLVVDYREIRATVLALVPLTVGVIWMLGAMRALGLSFNFANLVAVPLILGVGIDNGVHVVHRLRLEGDEGMAVVLRHTGRAILIASLTTMVGFGSLALASHRGLASLGTVLLIGVAACLVTSTVVLPNLLVALGAVRR